MIGRIIGGTFIITVWCMIVFGVMKGILMGLGLSIGALILTFILSWIDYKLTVKEEKENDI